MKRFLTLSFLLSFAACGGPSSANLDVVLASNSGVNVIKQLDSDYNLGKSRGIYFQIDALNCPGTSIEDVSGADSKVFPDSTGGGFSPTQASFDLPGSLIKPGLYYRVQMIAKAIDGTTTHSGVGDCPIKLSLATALKSSICFGKDPLTTPPICPGLRAFKDCPGISTCQ